MTWAKLSSSWVKIYSADYFCTAKIAWLGEFLSSIKKFGCKVSRHCKITPVKRVHLTTITYHRYLPGCSAVGESENS